MEQSTVRT